MPDYILFMRNDATSDVVGVDWQPYLAGLLAAGKLRGGSAIAGGTCFRRDAPAPSLTEEIVGFIRLQARDVVEVQRLLTGNPVYEAGGTVEVRALPLTD